MAPLIASDSTWLLWSVLLLCIALGFWSERTWVGARFSGAVVTLLLTFALSNSGIIPPASQVYDTIWVYIVPLSIPLLLLHVNFYRMFREMAALLAAFVIAVTGVALGTLLAFYSTPAADSKLAAAISAGFIGGPVNFSATAKTLGLAEKLDAGYAASNLMLFVCLLIIFILPTFGRFRRQFREPIRDDRFSQTTAEVSSEARKGARIHIPSLSFTLALSAALCAGCFWLEKTLGWHGSGILLLAAATILIALAFRKPLSEIEGQYELGLLFAHLLLAVTGAMAHLPSVISLDPMLFLFNAIVLAVHFPLLLLAGYFARLSLPELLVASNAGIGNVYSAVAMTAVKRWDHLITPAIVAAAVGAVSGSHIGIQLYRFMN